MDSVLDLAHRAQDRLTAFAGGERAQPFGGRELQIDAHAVREISGQLDQARVGTGDRLHMDVAIKFISGAQQV